MQNIYTLFREQTAKYRGKPVFYSRKGESWKSQNWEDFEEQVQNFACALLAKGLTKGAGVAILAGNVAEWAICDIGTIAAGGVGVGIYPTSSPEQCEYIINHSDAEFVVVDTEKQLEELLNTELPKVRKLFVWQKLKSILLKWLLKKINGFGNLALLKLKKLQLLLFKSFLNSANKTALSFCQKLTVNVGFFLMILFENGVLHGQI